MRDTHPSRFVPTDPGAYHRYRWRARAWTCLAVAVALGAAADIAARVTASDEATQKSAGWVFFQAGLVLGALTPVLWFQWRRSFRAKPQRLSVDDGDGAWIGVPELDEPPRQHLTLGEGAQVPRRW